MATADPKATVRAFYASIDADHAQSVPPMVSEQIVVYQPGMPPMDRTTFQQFGQAFYAAFPDLTHTIADQIAEGDAVASRLVVRGTHQGEFQGIPPTGRPVEITAFGIHRVQDGQIVEQQLLFDALGLLQQLGVMPAPASA
jgi:steroid delta-isomerase-like uncharacterized protein